jgi:hypothetical protein
VYVFNIEKLCLSVGSSVEKISAEWCGRPNLNGLDNFVIGEVRAKAFHQFAIGLDVKFDGSHLTTVSCG